MSVRLGHRWTSKPPLGYGLDRAHPLAQGLVAAFPMNEAAGPIANLVDGGLWARTGTSVWTPSTLPMARCPSFDGSTQYFDKGSALLTGAPMTLLCWAYPTSNAVDMTMFALADGSTANRIELTIRGTLAGDPFRLVLAAASVGAGNVQPTNAWNINAWNLFVGRCQSTTARDAVLNANLAGKGTGTGSSVPTGINATSIGRRPTGTATQFWVGLIGMVLIYNRAIADSEIVWHWHEPFAWVLPPRVRAWPGVSGAPAMADPASMLMHL
jgi:hypothetical protein